MKPDFEYSARLLMPGEFRLHLGYGLVKRNCLYRRSQRSKKFTKKKKLVEYFFVFRWEDRVLVNNLLPELHLEMKGAFQGKYARSKGFRLHTTEEAIARAHKVAATLLFTPYWDHSTGWT